MYIEIQQFEDVAVLSWTMSWEKNPENPFLPVQIQKTKINICKKNGQKSLFLHFKIKRKTSFESH